MVVTLCPMLKAMCRSFSPSDEKPIVTLHLQQDPTRRQCEGMR